MLRRAAILALLLLLIVWLFLFPAFVSAGVLTAKWTAPTTNVDGSPLTNLVSYRLYWYLYPNAPCPGTQFIVVNAPTTTVDLTGLTQGLSYSASVTAVNSNNQESTCSGVTTAVARADAAVGPTQPGAPISGTPTLGTVTAQIPVTWTPSTDTTAGSISYSYNGANDDGTGQFSGTTNNPNVILTRAYHSSGLAQTGWMCVIGKNNSSGMTSPSACNTSPLPAKPITSNFILTTSAGGTGHGTVTPSTGPQVSGTNVTVTATPAADSTFAGWLGACTGTAACVVPMNANQSVTATFTLKPVTVPPPVIELSSAQCTVVLSATPPDATTGWSARFKMDSTIVGTTDATPNPAGTYVGMQTAIAPGSHSHTVEWLKGGTVQVTTSAIVQTCP